MSDLKLFRIADGRAHEIKGGSVALEVSLQRLIEANMEALFGVRFLATEYSTGAKHKGRIDSLGLDETGSPVIFEYKYKRAVNESVINQGLFYLDWLVDHKAEFKLLVMERLGADVGAEIDWGSPRVICVASGFTRYDEHAVGQMGKAIELVRYQDFEGELLALELVTAARGEPISSPLSLAPLAAHKKTSGSGKTVSEYLAGSPQPLQDLFADLESFLEALGDDVTKKAGKTYFVYRLAEELRVRRGAPGNTKPVVYLKVHPDSVHLEEGFSRDVRSVGHFGTGDLELRIKDAADLAKAQPLIQQSYDVS